MKKQDSLFELISILSGQEKRYFRIWVEKQKGSKRYLDLYTFLDKQSSYDETALKRAFPTIKQLHVVKNYLYNNILQCMRSFHAEKSPEMIVRGYLDNIEFLYDKGLYKAADKIVEKAKKHAHSHALLEYLLRLKDWERRLHLFKNKNLGQQLFETIVEERAIIVKTLNLEHEYMALHDNLVKLIQQGFRVNSDTQKKDIELIIQNMNSLQQHKTLSIRAKLYFIRAHLLYSIYTNDYNSSDNWGQQLLNLFEQQPSLIKANTIAYITALQNRLLVLGYLNQFDEFEEIIDKLKSYEKHSTHVAIYIFSYAYHDILDWYLESNQPSKLNDLLVDIEHKLSLYKTQMTQESVHTYYYNLSLVFYELNVLDKAIHYINQYLNYQNRDANELMYDFGRLFSLLIHFSLKNYQYVASEATAMYRYLYRKKKMSSIEKTMLLFLQDYTTFSPKKLKDLLLQLKSELIEAYAIPYEKSTKALFDFEKWVDNQLALLK